MQQCTVFNVTSVAAFWPESLKYYVTDDDFTLSPQSSFILAKRLKNNSFSIIILVGISSS
jgi:hypothetical protein